MKISYNWLKTYLNTELPAQTISEILTDNGLEVEGLEEHEQVKGSLKGVVAGHVLSCEKIEGTDHLHLTQVDVGAETLQIVCGAPNVAAEQKVLVALPGATLHFADGNSITIKKAKMRGVESNGMICAEDELGLGKSHAGIVVLPTDTIVGTEAAKIYNISSDSVFEIGLTPNRSDAMCHTGVARDIVAALHNRSNDPAAKLTLPSVEAFKADNNDLVTPVEVRNPEACIRYSGLTLSNVNVTESPAWLKSYLESVGLRPINVVVDVTQFVMLELGQPLHAFDYDKIGGGKVIVEVKPEGTSFLTLDGVERKLSGRDLMICDAEKGMCIAGVFGGAHSGVTMETKRIFLESACFSPVHIRKTAKFHGLHTDASFRYERGTDPEITLYAAKRVALLLKELTGCTISSDVSDFYPSPVSRPEIHFRFDELSRFAGSIIPATVVQSILRDLDFNIKSVNGEEIVVEAPLNRTDVLRDVDVYEEVLRIFGYNNIPMPAKANTIYPSNSGLVLHDLIQKVSNYLVAKGFNEIMCNSLSSMQWFEKSEVFETNKIVTLQNALSRELNVMRISMLPGVLQSVAYNINRSAADLRFFELGKTYRKVSDDKETPVTGRYSESNMLSLTMTGSLRPENWKYSAEKSDFFIFKSVMEDLFRHFALAEGLSSDDQVPPMFAYGMQYTLNEKPLAVFGLVKPSVCQLSDVDAEVWFAEINLDILLKKLRKSSVRFREIPKFPSMRRDLSLLLDKNVTFAQIRDAAMTAEKKLLKQVALFDVYIDKKIGDDKKSYAVSFIFRHEDKTLTDVEADKAMERISTEVLKVTGGSIR